MLFETWFPMCRQYGMTEEEFWHSNPRKIKVYEEAWKRQKNFENQINFMIWGNYAMSAFSTVLSNILSPMFCKKPGNAHYLDEPVRIFEMTEQELEEYKAEQTRRFIEYCNNMKSMVKEPDSK